MRPNRRRSPTIAKKSGELSSLELTPEQPPLCRMGVALQSASHALCAPFWSLSQPYVVSHAQSPPELELPLSVLALAPASPDDVPESDAQS